MRRWLYAILLVLCACSAGQVRFWYIRPAYPTGPVPAWYQDAYNAARRCAGDMALPNRRYENIRWRYSQAIFVLRPDGQARLAQGATVADTVTLDLLYTDDWETVTHEALHHTLGDDQPDGSPFFESCAAQLAAYDPR